VLVFGGVRTRLIDAQDVIQHTVGTILDVRKGRCGFIDLIPQNLVGCRQSSIYLGHPLEQNSVCHRSGRWRELNLGHSASLLTANGAATCVL